MGIAIYILGAATFALCCAWDVGGWDPIDWCQRSRKRDRS